MANIKDLQDQRATFLTRLYGAVDASTGYYIDGQELANELNMDRETLDKIGSYLSQEGFIQRMGAFGKNMSITHQGIKEAERILEKQGFTSIPNSKVQATSVASEPQQKSGASESSPAGNLDKDAQIKSATLSDSAVEIKDDALDHGIYAAALVDFLTHKDSKPPFALAITGPW
ncbi:MAG: hypothetical protein MJA83_01570, partial [Gammaproteobacteria bacterium]|nr:hypothetical protein [Gammaproteobacteria bacterium]